MIKQQNGGDLRVYLGLQFWGDKHSLWWGRHEEVMSRSGHRSRKLSAHTTDCKHRVKRTLEVGWGSELSKPPPPSVTHFSQGGCTSKTSPNSSINWETRYSNAWAYGNHLLLKPPHSTSSPAPMGLPPYHNAKYIYSNFKVLVIFHSLNSVSTLKISSKTQGNLLIATPVNIRK